MQLRLILLLKKVCLPQQLLLRLSCKTKSTDADERVQLLQSPIRSLDEILQVKEGSIQFSFFENNLHETCLQAFYVNESRKHFVTLDTRVLLAAVHTGGLYISAGLQQLEKIELPGVESAEVVDHGHHEFFRVISLQVQTHVALYRE